MSIFVKINVAKGVQSYKYIRSSKIALKLGVTLPTQKYSKGKILVTWYLKIFLTSYRICVQTENS